MNVWDILILVLIAGMVIAGFVVRNKRKKEGKGCCSGSCSSCGCGCGEKKKSDPC